MAVVGLNLNDEEEHSKESNCKLALELARKFLVSTKVLNMKVKIAISCGDVHCGFLSVEKLQFIIIGNEVNLVSRICDKTDQNSVGITKEVYQAFSGYFNKATIQMEWTERANLEVIKKKKIQSYIYLNCTPSYNIDLL